MISQSLLVQVQTSAGLSRSSSTSWTSRIPRQPPGLTPALLTHRRPSKAQPGVPPVPIAVPSPRKHAGNAEPQDGSGQGAQAPRPHWHTWPWKGHLIAQRAGHRVAAWRPSCYDHSSSLPPASGATGMNRQRFLRPLTQTWVRGTQWNKNKWLVLNSPPREPSISPRPGKLPGGEQRGGGPAGNAATGSGEKEGLTASPCLSSGTTTPATKRRRIKAICLGRLGGGGE